VLVTPPAGYLVDVPSDAGPLIDERRGEPAFDAALEAWDAGPGTEEDDGFNEWQARVAPLSYATWGAVEQEHARLGWVTYAGNRAFFSVEPPEDLPARLAAVTAPVLVVAGARDIGTGVTPVLAVAQLFPAGESALIEGSGHMPWVEQPVAFRRAVDRFLAGLPH
jgi:pimeloyl-ACP methyl ester carboxylesterase